MTANYNELMSQIEGKNASKISSVVRTRPGRYSMGIVLSERNGKRVSFSAALVERLDLKDSVYITAYPSEGLLILGSTAYNADSAEFSLRNSSGSGKLCYNTALVKYLINAYHLEYGDHVSRSFTDFVFNEDDTTPMAILKLRTSLAEVPAEKEDVEEDEIVFDEEDWTDDTEDSEN